jgi:hypothetical protein
MKPLALRPQPGETPHRLRSVGPGKYPRGGTFPAFPPFPPDLQGLDLDPFRPNSRKKSYFLSGS